MLGNIVTNPNLLEDTDKRYYRECYCGLCKSLQKEHKNISRFTLNYDMTFLIVLLNEVYKENNEKLECRCMMHPVNKHTYINGIFVDYVADMNILLAYYNLLDDWQDDKNVFANCYAKLIKKSFKKICKKYPKKSEIVQNSLKELNDLETENIINPDLSAQCCGKLFGEIFAPFEDEHEEKLRNFGDSLGKFIYILDACIDFEKDIKKKRYNPLITNSKTEFDDMLNLLLADCVEKYKELNISNKIIENILYSGIWTKYEIHKKKGEK